MYQSIGHTHTPVRAVKTHLSTAISTFMQVLYCGWLVDCTVQVREREERREGGGGVVGGGR